MGRGWGNKRSLWAESVEVITLLYLSLERAERAPRAQSHAGGGGHHSQELWGPRGRRGSWGRCEAELDPTACRTKSWKLGLQLQWKEWKPDYDGDFWSDFRKVLRNPQSYWSFSRPGRVSMPYQAEPILSPHRTHQGYIVIACELCGRGDWVCFAHWCTLPQHRLCHQ